jgi:RNA polymerase-binding protein DksA
VAKKTTKKSSSTPKKPSIKKPAKSTTKPIARPATARVAKRAPVAAVKAVKAKPAPVVEAKPVVKPLKPGRNQAGLSTKDLEHYRDLLLAKRRELLGDVDSMEDEALRNSGGANLSNLPIHMADMGTDNYEQEFTLGLVEKDRRILHDIHAALAKIQNGSFGICEGTGKPISKARLDAQPWTRYSIEHARKLEQRVRPG